MLEPLFIYADYHERTAVTATDTKSGTAAIDVLQPDEDNYWQPANAVGTKMLQFDFVLYKTFGAVGIVGDYLNNVTVEIRGSNDNFTSENVQLLPPTAMVEYQANWFAWDNDGYRYARVYFTGFGLSFAVSHVSFCPLVVLPSFADGIDPQSYQTDGEHVVSADGYYLGGRKSKTMIKTSLDFGQLLDDEYAAFQAWGDVCVKGFKPFVYVPDMSGTRCYMAWVDKGFTFSAPYKSGMRSLPKIPITARVV